MTLKDKHVLITGGSSGIGLAVAIRAAAEGARVSLVARDLEKLERARESIAGASPSARVALAKADVSKLAQVESALRELEGQLGPVDVLVTAAGIATPGYFEEIPIGVFEETMAVNYLGTLYAVRAVAPGMRARRSGNIVMISSGAGLVGIFGYTPYSPSKFAVRGLAEALRGELKPDNVTVTIVYPPDTKTPQLEAECRTKPAETRAITQSGGLWTANAVARITLEAAQRGRFAVAPGAQLTALLWLGSLLAPLLRWKFDQAAAQAARPRGRTP